MRTTTSLRGSNVACRCMNLIGVGVLGRSGCALEAPPLAARAALSFSGRGPFHRSRVVPVRFRTYMW